MGTLCETFILLCQTQFCIFSYKYIWEEEWDKILTRQYVVVLTREIWLSICWGQILIFYSTKYGAINRFPRQFDFDQRYYFMTSHSGVYHRNANPSLYLSKGILCSSVRQILWGIVIWLSCNISIMFRIIDICIAVSWYCYRELWYCIVSYFHPYLRGWSQIWINKFHQHR